MVHERGSPETLRDPRGFAVKFYTREGNFDMVGNNMPVREGRACECAEGAALDARASLAVLADRTHPRPQVFFIRDGMKFPDLVHAFKPNPKSNQQEWWRMADFLSHHPESTHMLTFLLDDAGIPLNYRHMPGFGVHAFKLLNKAGAETYVKFHWLPKCGKQWEGAGVRATLHSRVTLTSHTPCVRSRPSLTLT